MGFAPLRSGWHRSAALPALTAPTILANGSAGVTQAALTSAAFTPTAGALLLCEWICRDNTEAAVDAVAPTPSGFSITGAWQIRNVRSYDTDNDRWVGAALLFAVVAASPGEGTLEFATAGDTFNQIYRVNQILEGFDPDLASWVSDDAAGETTSLGYDLGTTPAVADMVYTLCGSHGSNAGAFAAPSGHTGVARQQQGSNLDSKASYKLGAAGATGTWTGLDAAEADAVVALLIPQDT